MPERLIDRFGRPFRYVRISLTDRCQLRCLYCIPNMEVLKLARREEILTYEEILSLLEILVEDFGVEKVRFTGGEPLFRNGVLDFLFEVRSRFPDLPIGLTTNGLTLVRDAPLLKDLGINLNVSLDTLDRKTFRELTGLDALDRVVEGMKFVRSLGMSFKINTVLLKGWNETQLLDLVAFARSMGVPIRFIEYMPVSSAKDFHKLFLSEMEARRILERVYTLVPEDHSPYQTARMYRAKEDPSVRIGFISTVSRPFCHNCTRLRITATGKLVLCLFDKSGYTLKDMLRPEVKREKIKEFFRTIILKRPPGFASQRDEIMESRLKSPDLSMRSLGG